MTQKFGKILKKPFVIFPGAILATVVAISAKFISDHYSAPAMLMALLLGITLNFLSEDGKCVRGIDFCATTILRLGVALLGTTISIDLIIELGAIIIFYVVLAVSLTILFGLILAPVFKQTYVFAFLSSGSVAICGASAAIAISAILPNDDRKEERLLFTILGVTLLSTVSMIAYPLIGSQLGFNNFEMGVFLGATIHDVAQVVGAGFSVSAETGEIATTIKLIRVAMLAPVVILASILIWSKWEPSQVRKDRPVFVPFFVIIFILLASLNSLIIIPEIMLDIASKTTGWALLIAISAVGMKTRLQDVTKVGQSAFSMLICQTLFLGFFIVILLLLK